MSSQQNLMQSHVDVKVQGDSAGQPAAGIVDGNGVLWKATKVGSFNATIDGVTSAWVALEKRCAETPKKLCVGKRPVLTRELEDGKFEKFTLGPYEYLTCEEYIARVHNFGRGLLSVCGKELMETKYVVVYAETQLEWMLSAYAAWRQGLTVVTIYATLGPEGTEFGLNQTKASTVVADAKLLKVIAKVASKCTALKHIITITDDVPAETVKELEGLGITVTSMANVEKAGQEGPEASSKPTPAGMEDVAVLMYTSGTTGQPKGVELMHSNLIAMLACTFCPTGAVTAWPAKFKVDLSKDPTYLAYLPLAHIMEMAVEVAMMYIGVKLCYGSAHTLTATGVKMKQTKPPQIGDAAAARPTIMVFAPAVLDKVYAKVSATFAEKKGLIACLVKQGFQSGYANYDKGGVGAKGLGAAIVFKKVQKLLGGRVQIALTGSAPLSPDVQKWVQTVFNCPCRQGYGLTETTAATCIALATDNGTSMVGPPQECACIRLRDWPEGKYHNEDMNDPKIGMRRGEILIGGPGVCKGYFTDPSNPDPEIVEKNATDFVEMDGIRYFCTGDIGQITATGNVQIIDRKKDLVKLQQGEYVALSKVENVLKNSKYVELPMAYAVSSESYCIALVCPMPPALKALAAELGVSGDHEALCKDAAINAAVLKDLTAECKKKLVGFEIPTKLVLISDVWTVENDMLTAAMKLKRKPIVDRHMAEIQALGYGS